TVAECCACNELRAVRKIRIGPDRIKELGIRYVVPEFGLFDDLLDRTMRGLDASDIAAPEVVRDLSEVLLSLGVSPLDASLGMLNEWHVARGDGETGF